MLRKLADRLQIDKPLAFALAARLWQAFSGPITIVLIIRSLTQDEQGIYYALVPIIGIQAFFELGLLNVLISQAGHASGAYWRADQAGDREARATAASRMDQLIRASSRWFGMASGLFFITALTVGWSTFSGNNAKVDWQWPLVVLVPLAAVSVYVAPKLAILEGAGQRELVYRFRFWQVVSGSLAVWLALVSGLGIWALVIATGVQAIWAVYLSEWHQSSFFGQFFASAQADGAAVKEGAFSWVADVLPQQWRVAVSGATFHLATQFLAFIVFTFHTAAESGRLGMTLSITTAIQMLALSWVQTKYSLISNLHGQGQRMKAGTMWRTTTIVSTLLMLVAFLVLTTLVAVLPMFGRGWETRFIPPSMLIVLGIGCLANHLVAVQAFYVLARGRRPLVVALTSGYLVTAIAVWIGGYYGANWGVVTAFTAGITFVALPIHTLTYVKFRQEL